MTREVLFFSAMVLLTVIVFILLVKNKKNKGQPIDDDTFGRFFD